MTDNNVRLVDKPACLICGVQGQKIYRGLADRINGVPGKWEVRRGNCGECRAVWLDPAPLPEDVGKLYEGNYFTHSGIAESKDMLIHELSAYLINRQRDQEGRERIVASHLGAIDGASWQRVLAVTHRLVNGMSA